MLYPNIYKNAYVFFALSLDKTPSAPESTLNEDGFGSLGKSIKPVLHEGFIEYPVPI